MNGSGGTPARRGGRSRLSRMLMNGGVNTLEMWMDHVGPLSGDCRVLRFDYPQEPRTDRALAAGLRPSRTAL